MHSFRGLPFTKYTHKGRWWWGGGGGGVKPLIHFNCILMQNVGEGSVYHVAMRIHVGLCNDAMF